MTSHTSSSTPRPEPVTKAGALAGITSAVLLLVGLIARAFGWVSDDLDMIAVANRASDVVLGAGALWSAAAPIALAVRARGKVTPLADPRDTLGRVLSVADQATPIVDELRHYLEQLRPAVVDQPAPAPAPVEDPATTALLGRSLYDELVDEHAAAAAPALPPVPAPATVTGSTTVLPPVPVAGA